MVTPPTGRFRAGALAAAAFLAAAAALPGQVAPGARFPALSKYALTGAALPDTAGRVVLVDFWASWCAPCKASFPAYTQLQAQYAAAGLVIVAVSVDDDPAAFASFVARHKPGFAALGDPAHALVAAVQVPTMPTCYVLDRGGTVRFMHAGFRAGETERALRGEIGMLLAEKPPAP
jgi:thiol-disulfide isomerase/thioredoxin